jgi:hypothetical protein
MGYKIKSFMIGVKEARQMISTTVYGRPAQKAYDIGRKVSNRVTGILKCEWLTKAPKRRSRRVE